MVGTAFNTVVSSNGQQVLRTAKEKNTDFHAPAMEKYVSTLIDDQDGLCAISGIRLQYDGEENNTELLCSLDWIDSAGHYVAVNLQVVCRFVNKWKNASSDTEFRRLMALVRATSF